MPHKVYPFYFVWNDYDTSRLDGHCGIKWHRHANEPTYNCDDPRCQAFIDEVRARGIPILIEEEYENTLRFVDEMAQGMPIIIPHMGYLNGGVKRLLDEDFWRRPNTYADMSGGTACRAEDVKRFLDRYGPERMLFGSDYPCCMPLRSKNKIGELGLPDADLRLIYSENVLRLIGGAARR